MQLFLNCGDQEFKRMRTVYIDNRRSRLNKKQLKLKKT